jgi:hypothetical protein
LEYLHLVKDLSEYAQKLLSHVRDRDELEIVLNKTGTETEEKYERLARLDLALKYEEKYVKYFCSFRFTYRLFIYM